MKTRRILVAGSGGQGIVTLGKLLANSALRTAPHVTFFPSYGAEVRGGTSTCQVILSADEIPSPVADEFDLMILMHPAAAERFIPRLAPDGLAVLNSSLCPPPPCPGPACVQVPATQRADDLGDVRTANLVMLGALIAREAVVPPADLESEMSRQLGEKSPALRAINLAAFRAGLAS